MTRLNKFLKGNKKKMEGVIKNYSFEYIGKRGGKN